MAQGQKIRVGSSTFKSVRAAAVHFHQNYGNVVRRLNSGWSIKEALGLASRSTKRPWKGKTLKTSEKTFLSIRDAAEYFGIKEATLVMRLKRGWTPDQAVGLIPHKRRPRVTRPILVAGVEYPNSWALAQRYGKRGELVAKRMRLGWTPEQAVELVEPPPRFRNQVNGATNKHWKSIEIVDDKEYPATTYGEYKLYVIRNKRSGKEYVGITINPLWQRFNGHKRNAKIGVKSKLYNAMRRYGFDSFEIELIRSNARSFAELQKQEAKEILRRDSIQCGYNVSPGGAIGTPTAVTVGGLVFPSRGSAAEHFGIAIGVFNLRISRLGWTPEQAAEIEPRGKYSRKKVIVDGKTFPSLKKAAESYGLDYRLVYDRLNGKSWSLEQALGIVLRPKSKPLGKAVGAFGLEFRSYSECANHFGIKAASLRNRMVNFKEAAEIAIHHLQSL